jgi:hypothetical protein
MTDEPSTAACPHCGADNRVGELVCMRCGRQLPRSSSELREQMIRRLERERRARRTLHLAFAIAIGVGMAVAVRLFADLVPQDIVGMPVLVEIARYLWWLVGIIWGGLFYAAIRSGRD